MLANGRPSVGHGDGGADVPDDRRRASGCAGQRGHPPAPSSSADRLGIDPQKVELYAVLLDLMVEGSEGEQHPELARHPRWAECRGQRHAGVDDHTWHSAPA